MVNVLEQEDRSTHFEKSEGRNNFFGNLKQPICIRVADTFDVDVEKEPYRLALQGGERNAAISVER